jgi:FKBP-type peptidyl-prolyl cis-trans isomerase FklB
MRSITFAPLACAAAVLCTASALAQSGPVTIATPIDAPTDAPSGLSNFKTSREAISYAIGVTTARNLGKDGVDIDPASVLKGMQDANSVQRTLLLSEKEIKTVMSGLVAEMRQKLAASRQEAELINQKKGDEFRAQFAKDANVKSLPSGVLYKVQRAGTGPKANEQDSVVVSYHGALTDGKEFDGTPEGKSVTFKLSQVIMGWKEALKLMPAGSRWTIVIPPNLAYGTTGAGTTIGPNETLVFDVELQSVSK